MFVSRDQEFLRASSITRGHFPATIKLKILQGIYELISAFTDNKFGNFWKPIYPRIFHLKESQTWNISPITIFTSSWNVEVNLSKQRCQERLGFKVIWVWNYRHKFPAVFSQFILRIWRVSFIQSASQHDRGRFWYKVRAFSFWPSQWCHFWQFSFKCQFLKFRLHVFLFDI